MSNLIPLQLNPVTGQVTAAQIPGVYTPATGTGFQTVTNGTPNIAALTFTQTTAALNLFTSTTQGLVSASGGGTTNFLRADGMWVAIPANGVASFNTRTGAVTLTSGDVGTALGYTAYNGTLNPLGFLTAATGLTALMAGPGIGVAGASLINLNTALTYAVIASSTITNTGFSVLTGNLALSPGTSVTGFPPGTVSGTQNINNGAAATALNDASNAFVAGNALVGYTTIPAELGATSPAPGYYTTGSSFDITGTLTLNGTANSVWVFKSPSSTLTTAVASSVVLTGGALPQNVYWFVGSSATIGVSSTFVGTVIAQASITVNTGASVNGHLFALTGAVTLADNAVTATPAGSGLVGTDTISNTGVLSFNARTGAVVLTSGDVTTALTFTPYNATNPAGYISALPAFTASGDVSGTFVPGSPGNIVLTLPPITTAGTYGIVTVNAKGQVTSGSSPTTLAGYGITDGVSSQVSTTLTSGVSLTFSGGGTIHGLPTPVVATDAVNKAYVDAVAQGLSWKAAVKAQTTANLVGTYVGSPTFTLTANPTAALPVIDGYAANVGDRILVNDQSTASQNGIYVVTQTTAPWILTRSSDFNEVTPIDEINGAAVYVEQGTLYDNTTWTQIDDVVTFDVSPINFTQLSSGGSGTVTNFSFTNSGGVSGIVTNSTTTPNLTLTLGAITPTSVNASGTVQGSNIAALAVVSGTNTGDQTITLTGDVTGSGTGSFATTLATVNANVGSFGDTTHVAAFTVNAKGLTTAASNVAITFPVTSVFGRTGIIVATSGDYSFNLLSGSATAAQLPALSATGDATGTGTAGTATIPLTLATVNANVGSFTNANITVDAKGRITAAANGSAGSGTVTSVAFSDTSTSPIYNITGSPVTTSGTLTQTLATQTAGTVFAGPVSGGAAQPTFRALTATDVPTNGVERVVWRLAASSTNTFTSSTPISITSGVTVSNVNPLTATSDYAFTGYDHPPVAIMLYGQQTGPNQWAMQSATVQTVLDTGTSASPNLITSFTSGNRIAAFQTDATATGATDSANTGSYIIVEFKF